MADKKSPAERRLLKIPNSKVLYSSEDQIYGGGREYRPHSDRLNHIGRGITSGITERVLDAIPDLPQGIVGAFVNPIKEGYKERNNAIRHASFREAGKVGLPGINSLYSLYAMSWGLTNPDITAVITIEADDGKEALLGFEYKGGVISPDKIGKKLLNKEAITAGVMAELMNEETEKSDIKDVNVFKSKYVNSEPFVYGAKGKRSVVGKDKDGKIIFRYGRPSRGEFLKYYLTSDVTYTILDWATNLAGSTLPGIAGQRFYEGEVEEVIKYTQGDYGTKNIGGAPNPFAAGYRKAA
jgi:hypothetical protein